MLPLGQAQELLRQLTRREKFAPHLMKRPQPIEDREELAGLPEPVAQLAGARIGRVHFQRGKSSGGL